MTLMEKVFRRTLPTFLTLAMVVLGGSLRTAPCTHSNLN